MLQKPIEKEPDGSVMNQKILLQLFALLEKEGMITAKERMKMSDLLREGQ